MIAVTLISLTGCSALASHRNEPQGCRERVAFALSDTYPDPNNLRVAIDAVCQGKP